jgi:cyclopropane fatty-acyl-phospholipid synthase-like methyltransferase
MDKDNKIHEVKKYWDNDQTESMYDKNIVEIEMEAILEQLSNEDNILDIGCGEGENTIEYFKKVKTLIALDYSLTRLEKLKAKNTRIITIQMDMRNISKEQFPEKFDKIITQRSLINLKNFEEQKMVIINIHSLLKDNGKYLMLEGFHDGSEKINKVRKDFGLPSIDIKWHNCFFRKKELLDAIYPYFTLEYNRDFSMYFFISRILNAIVKHPEIPKWNDNINKIAKKMELSYKNQFINSISRLEFLVFRKI